MGVAHQGGDRQDSGRRRLIGLPMIRRLRLASGQMLWFYIACHFVNHSLGLISLAAAEAGLKIAAATWQSWPGTAMLYGAFGTHLALALTGLHQRHTLRLPPLELARILFGLTIPLLLFGHVVGTRVAYSLYGEPAQYQRVVAGLLSSGNTGWQLALLAPGWLHGCMGLNVAFRHREWFQRWRAPLIGLVVALPLCAASGFWAMTRDIEALGIVTTTTVLTTAQRIALGELRGHLLTAYFVLLGGVLVSRSWRDWRAWRRREVETSS
jgi:adenylate cyclase